MLNFFKKNLGVISTFFITIIISLVIFLTVGILSGTILISDLNAEYQPLLLQLRRILTGEMGVYNFNTGMGDSFIGTFYYYMSSPLNILTLFIKDINLLVIILVLLKLGLASSFCYIFFKYQFSEEKKLFLTTFSILYALSSFSLSYYLHIMWLDIYMIFPSLMLGIDKIIKEKKHLLYIISLILIIFCNYYFAYMVCIFSFIYFNYKILLDKISFKSLLKNNIHFIIINLLAIMCSSIVLIPIASEISTYSRQNNMLFGGEKIKFSFDIITIVKNYILGNFDNIDLLNENNFYIYSSIIVVPLIYFYFINKEIKLREKLLSGIILLILILSISCNYINYIWHGFVPPSFFNGRYTFMFILFILLISLKSIYNLKEFKIYHYFLISLIVIGTILINEFNRKINLNEFDLFKIFIFLAYILIFMITLNKKYTKVIFALLIIIELNMNGNQYLNRYNFNVTHGDTTYENSINYIKKIDNSLFYRIEDNNSDSDNYSILYNYYGIDYFMSTLKKDLVNFFTNMDVGNHAYTKNTISYDGSYYLLSSLLNIKYYIETKYYDKDKYEYLTTINDEYKIYLNEYSLNIGYIVNSNILDTKLNKNGLENLNNIYKDMTDINILDAIKINKFDDYNYEFENTQRNNFYLLVKLKNWYSYDDLNIYINDELLDNYNNTFYYEINNIYELNDIVKIRLSCNSNTIDDIEGIYMYYINDSNFEKSINILKENQLEITSVKNNKIIGRINVDDNDILFTSIPYNNDLYIYVDGNKVEKIKLLNTFMGAKIDKGEHEIVIKYIPKTLYSSIIYTIISFIILYIYLKFYKKYFIKQKG